MNEDDAALLSLSGEEIRARSQWQMAEKRKAAALASSSKASELSPWSRRVGGDDAPGGTAASSRVRSIAREMDEQRRRPSALGKLRLGAILASVQPEAQHRGARRGQAGTGAAHRGSCPEGSAHTALAST